MSNWLFWVLKKANVLISPKPCEIQRFRRNFWPIGYLRNVVFAIFKKFSPPQKWQPFWIFEFLPKMAKHKFASISLTMRDRAISSKFSTHRVSKEWTLCNFQKKIPLLKNGGHFEFLPKLAKHEFASISLTVWDRAISSKFSTHRVSQQCTLGNFKKIPPPQKWRPFFEFSNFCQRWQNTKLLLSP